MQIRNGVITAYNGINDSGSVSITGSMFISGSRVSLISGSFSGSGAFLYDIPTNSIIGLDLSRISSGSATASISPDKGLVVNTKASIAENLQVSGSLIVSSSLTASAALITGTITAQTLVVQTITSSIIYSSGSNIFGNLITDRQTLTGSVYITGSLNVIGKVAASDITGSLFGTSSWAVSASWAPAQLNGTGFVKASGTSITYDNSTYYLASNPNSYIPLTALSSGTGISYSNITGVITNSAPDQTVSLTQGGTTTITGTYPNFTISSNDQYTGTVTSVGGTGTVSGLTLTGTVSTTGNLTLGGTLSLTSTNVTDGLGYTPYNATNPDGYVSNATDTYTATPKITNIITLSAAEYAAIGSPSTSVLYIII